MESSMAESKKSAGGLEYLGFARLIALSTAMCFLNLYEYAKENCALLRSTLGTLENAVATVLGPVFDKYKGIPDDALAFLDKKVGKAVSELDELAPPLAKSVVNVSKQVVQKAAEISHEMVVEVKVTGLRSALLRFAVIAKNFMEGHLPMVLYRVHRLPVVKSLTEKVIPTATLWTRKYNSFITKLASRGYHFFGYFPVIPIEDVTKAFKKDDQVHSTMTN